MKEHIPRNSYPSITEVVSNGGATPTNLPGSSQLWLGTRSPDLNTLDRMEEMIRRSAEAASMVTGVDHETRRVSATRPWLPNHKMMDIAYRNLELVGPPSFSDEDKEFTRELIRNYNGKEVDEPFDESLSAPDSEVTSGFLGGADDITEFSWHAPTCRINITYQPTVAKGYEIPSWIFSSLSKTNIAHESLITAAKAMSLTAIDLIQHEDELEEAWDEFRQRKRDNDIPLLISENDEPPIDDTIPPYYPEGWEPPVNIG